MYLLIRIKCILTSDSHLFTFHNVSINSMVQDYVNWARAKFTFHNVSINSNRTAYRYGHGFVIYIP